MRFTLKTLFNTTILALYWLLIEILSFFSILHKKKEKKKRPQLALLSYCLPPQFNSGTHRPLSFIKYAAINGWSVNAFTNQSDTKPTEAGIQLQKQLPKEVIIYHFRNNIGKTSWQLTPKIDGGFANAISLTFEGLKELRKNKTDIILASSPPFYFAVAGFFLSKIYKIPLVLDYRDEWSLCPFDFVSCTKFDKWFEKRCVQQASLILYTTQSHLEKHQRHFQLKDSKVSLVFNGWEEENELDKENLLTQKDREKIVISYIGRLSEHVDIESFINTLQKTITLDPKLKNTIILNFIGEKSDSKAAQISDHINRKELDFIINSINLVTKPQAIQYMKSSTYLLMLCNKELSGYIPGKLYDYLSVKKPIIAYGNSGEVTEVLKQTNMGCHIINNDAVALGIALKSSNESKPPSDSLDKWLATRTRKYQASQMYKKLNTLRHKL